MCRGVLGQDLGLEPLGAVWSVVDLFPERLLWKAMLEDTVWENLHLLTLSPDRIEGPPHLP